jgi:hypothetical protein
MWSKTAISCISGLMFDLSQSFKTSYKPEFDIRQAFYKSEILILTEHLLGDPSYLTVFVAKKSATKAQKH